MSEGDNGRRNGWTIALAAAATLAWAAADAARGQAYGTADRGSPGDEAIQAWLAHRARALDAKFAEDLKSADAFEEARPALSRAYMDMLGLEPAPPRTALDPAVVGVLDRGDYVVEKLHYQSVPGLYVTANLYRPKEIPPGTRLPGILYVCGHAGMGLNGNKTAYQSHGIWFARHGYVCLTVDTLQLGEIAGVHHGTYREGRWWWLSEGYTPAGVEAWNGIRGIDYLISRPEVDADRIGVTGISGGAAVTFWVAAADPRVKAAAAVSGMADLESYVGNRVVNGHCDCMFLYNAAEWPWTRIAGLIAPRPLLFVNSDNDPIFPMDANERVIARLERLYSLFGASDRVDALVSVGGHDYREDIRRGVYRFFNIHLRNDASPVTDSEIDVAVYKGNDRSYPIPPEELRVFKDESEFPSDARNGRVDESFVIPTRAGIPDSGTFEGWRAERIAAIRERALRPRGEGDDPGLAEIDIPEAAKGGSGVLLVSLRDDAETPVTALGEDESLATVRPRGVGKSRWTSKNPPNYVERSHFLLGTTVDRERVAEIARAIDAMEGATRVEGRGKAGLLGALAVIEADAGSKVGSLILDAPALDLRDPDAPVVLNLGRISSVAEILGTFAPRPMALNGVDPEHPTVETLRKIYRAAGAEDNLKIVE